ncbi:MAG: 30S ribosome-binding factor RbfA [Chlamydiales bacterium]
MSSRRIQKINSLLKEVISDVIREKVKNPHLSSLVSITYVDVAKDLHQAKVFVSIIGETSVQNEGIKILQSASGFIGIHASQQVNMRYFPKLKFILDKSINQEIRIGRLMSEIENERKIRKQ